MRVPNNQIRVPRRPSIVKRIVCTAVVAMPCTMNGRIGFTGWSLVGLACSSFDL
jgi:hypothetical protein